eukprot:Polyplicarium_translucidae@DN3676_c0_g1_i1.p1
MVACRVTEEDVEMAMAEVGHENCASVCVAVVYGPKNLVLSGSRSEIDKILVALNLHGAAKFIRVSHAFQSNLMDEAIGPVSQLMAACDLAPPKIRLLEVLWQDAAATLSGLGVPTSVHLI